MRLQTLKIVLTIQNTIHQVKTTKETQTKHTLTSLSKEKSYTTQPTKNNKTMTPTTKRIHPPTIIHPPKIKRNNSTTTTKKSNL